MIAAARKTEPRALNTVVVTTERSSRSPRRIGDLADGAGSMVGRRAALTVGSNALS
jgi:hypothetical protein